MADINYQRLTRTSSRTGFAVVVRSRGSLWLGPDHLLCVETNGYRENYKRFYFRDIQAIIVQQTRRRVIWNAILPVPLAFGSLGLLAFWMAGQRNEAAIILCLIFLGIFLLLFAINNLLGTGCVCYLRTAVQIEQLPSLYRVPKARKVLAKIRPLIVAAQGGELSPEIVMARMRQWSLSSPSEPQKTVVEDSNVPPRLEP
jgi:hypothetical protein